VSGVQNPTSMTFGPDRHLYVSSRFDGSVHRVLTDGTVTTFATDLGVACGIAFGPDGRLYVGDRSGSILVVSDTRVTQFAAIPPSVAAFHLAFGPDGWLYVSAPTLSSHDVVYRVSPPGVVEEFAGGFGRPQGLAFDKDGSLYVVDAIAGDSALLRMRPDRPAEKECVLSGGALIGLAFDSAGGMVVASSDTVYRFAAAGAPPV
jgi:sugar lactone lactonase YvrE